MIVLHDLRAIDPRRPIATGRIVQTKSLSTETTAIRTLSVLGIALVLLYLVNNESCALCCIVTL